MVTCEGKSWHTIHPPPARLRVQLREQAIQMAWWMPKRSHRIRVGGFTLAELLIALAILGLIATFTIPKVLQSSQDSTYKSIAKEVAAMLSEGYQVYKSKNGNSYMLNTDLTPYLNYVSLYTSSQVDSSEDCSNTADIGCLKLHNGGILIYYAGDSFCQNPNAGMWFEFDPDGKGDGKYQEVQFWLYINGKVRTSATKDTNTATGWLGAPTCGGVSGTPGTDPPWFSWN